MSQLATQTRGSQYSDEDRRLALILYNQHGSCVKVSEHSHIPERTVNDWTHSDWWEDELAVIREENKDLIRASITRIVTKGFDNIEDRIENGDEYITKDGQKDRKKASLRDLGTVTGIAFDKLRLLNNEPTSIQGKADIEATLDQFRQLAQARVVEGEILDKQEDSGE